MVLPSLAGPARIGWWPGTRTGTLRVLSGPYFAGRERGARSGRKGYDSVQIIALDAVI